MTAGSGSAGKDGAVVCVEIVTMSRNVVRDGRSIKPDDPGDVEAVRGGSSTEDATTLNEGCVTDDTVMEAGISDEVITMDADDGFSDAASTPDEAADAGNAELSRVVCVD